MVQALVTGLFHKLPEGFEFALQSGRRSAACQPELLWSGDGLQTFLKRIVIHPGDRWRRDPPHGQFHPITEIEQPRAWAEALGQALSALTDHPELILFPNTAGARSQLRKAAPPPANQH